ncbi:MAG: hypothetical protein OEM38_00290 [Gammaproteobacteria bacterium]|nr:hypothetical protein [Gammaproteobacteria bacterium]
MGARKLFTVTLLIFVFQTANAEIVGKEVDYALGDAHFKGYIAYDDAIKGTSPGEIVVHEW